ncbi:MAG: hypothetical protein IKY52_02535 [Clostridia bacterium]|nr:hypothetical protein [Clostridia bacterium]
MKRTLSALLSLLMIVCIAASAVSAADAADGDLLYTADFSDAGYKVLGVNDGFIYEAIDGGAGVTMYSKADNTEDKNNVWGIYLDDLGVQNGEKYTLTYKVRANGEVGKNNSVGLGMVTSGSTDEGGPCVYNFYSNHNTINAEGSTDDRRGTFAHGGSKMVDYIYEIKDADEDSDLFITIKQEIDTAAKTVKAYTLVVDKWVFLQEQPIEITADSKACVMFRLHYAAINTTYKDVKIYKGIGLTDEQLAGPVAEEVVVEDIAAAPQTFDMGVIAAVAAIISAAGYAVSKKR